MFFRLGLFTVFYVSLFIFPAWGQVSESFSGVWAGIEVMGLDLNTSKSVRDLLPIKIGDRFDISESSKYRRMCEVIKKNYPAYQISCSFIGYPESKFYYDVEFSSVQSKKSNNSFRYISERSNVDSVSQKLTVLHDQWEKRYWSLISSGHFPKEHFDNGFLDFEDPELHSYAIKLTEFAYRENSKLLDVIYFSSNPEQRKLAANLLSWSRHPENIEFVLKWNLLNDSNPKVRNELSRSISLGLDKIEDERLLKKAIPVFCKQAALPTHTDRNKALTSILQILNQNPKVSTEIDSECRKTISYIGKMSILPNSGGVARQIDDILGARASD